MCESDVFLLEGEEERKIMEDAVKVERVGDKIRITDVLGTSKDVEGDLEEITFLDHRIVIKGSS